MHKSDKKKIIFIHNQKTAGASMREFLKEHISDFKMFLPNHAYAVDGIEKIGRENWDRYYTFGFVRNPWERLASWYSMIKEGSKDENKLWRYVHRNSSNFKEFLKNCTDTIVEHRGDFLYRKSFVRNQLDYFTDQDGEIAVDFIGKFERLESDFRKIKTHLGLENFTLPHLNKGNKKSYKEYYEEETVKLVAQRFKKDIEHFNYSF